MRIFFQALLLSCCVLSGAAEAGILEVTPQDVLLIAFTSDPTVVPCPLGPCDGLSFNVVLDTPAPGVEYTASLFSSDGTLLGTTTDEFFRSPTSVSAFGTVIDFTALQGPFSGFFDVVPNQTVFVDTTLTNVDLGNSTSPAGGEFNPGTATVQSVSLVPEPRYAGLGGMLSCLALGWRLIRLRSEGPKRAHSVPLSKTRICHFSLIAKGVGGGRLMTGRLAA